MKKPIRDADVKQFMRDYERLYDRTETGTTAFGDRYLDAHRKKPVSRKPARKR